MSVEEFPPEAIAALQPSEPGPEMPEAPVSPMLDLDPTAASQALLTAVQRCGEKGAGAPDSRETKEYATAALAFAQAIVTLDPTRVGPSGDTPEARAASIPVPPVTDGDHDGQIGE